MSICIIGTDDNISHPRRYFYIIWYSSNCPRWKDDVVTVQSGTFTCAKNIFDTSRSTYIRLPPRYSAATTG